MWERQVADCFVGDFPPYRQNLFISPNTLPLLLPTVAHTFFPWVAVISLHLLLRDSKKGRKTPPCICSIAELSFSSETAGSPLVTQRSGRGSLVQYKVATDQ